MSGTIPQPEMKALFMKSSGVCAFPGCGKELLETGNELDNPAIAVPTRVSTAKPPPAKNRTS